MTSFLFEYDEVDLFRALGSNLEEFDPLSGTGAGGSAGADAQTRDVGRGGRGRGTLDAEDGRGVTRSVWPQDDNDNDNDYGNGNDNEVDGDSVGESRAMGSAKGGVRKVIASARRTRRQENDGKDDEQNRLMNVDAESDPGYQNLQDSMVMMDKLGNEKSDGRNDFDEEGLKDRNQDLADVPQRRAGATTLESSVPIQGGCCWSDGNAQDFKVRVGPNYSKHKKKGFSARSLYRQVGMDVFRNTFDKETKISHVAEHVRLPEPSSPRIDVNQPCPLPRLIICNIQVPLNAPKMWGKPDPDAGLSLVQYFEIDPETYEASLDLENAAPSVKLFANFFKECMYNDDYARRFKVVGLINNMAQVGVPAMFQSYNGKPMIVFKTGKLYRGHVHSNRPHDEYFEIDINVHDFGYLPRKGIHSLLDRVPQMEIQCGYVIQGETDEELPENLLACSAMRLDLSKAVAVDFHPQGVSRIQKRYTFN